MKPVVGKRLWVDPMLSIIHALTPAALGNGDWQCLQVPVVLAFKGPEFQSECGRQAGHLGRRAVRCRERTAKPERPLWSRCRHMAADRPESVCRLSGPDQLWHDCSALRL